VINININPPKRIDEILSCDLAEEWSFYD